MSKPPRCSKCEHRPGPRVLSYVREPKPAFREVTPPRQHKKPCACECHAERAGVSL